MKNKWVYHFENYLSNEIAIEYKACLYFFAILFFHTIYLWMQGIYDVRMLIMCEMILSTYVMGYLQVYVLHNFDEAEHIGKKEILEILMCSCLYTGASYLFRWFDRNRLVTGLFFAFMVLGYVCVYLINKVKRKIDTENLNRMLTEFKKGE